MICTFIHHLLKKIIFKILHKYYKNINALFLRFSGYRDYLIHFMSLTRLPLCILLYTIVFYINIINVTNMK